jgi:flagellar assembly protein FliH
LSNLIKGDGQSILCIEAFEAEDVSDHLPSEEDFQERLARLEKEAYEKGFEQGQRDGLALEKRQMEEKGRQLEKIMAEINGFKARLYSEGEQDLLKLCTLAAKTIIRQEVRTHPGIIGNTIRATLEYLVDKSMICIHISPDDMDEVRRVLPDLSSLTRGGKFQLMEDNAIKAGGCIIETGFGRINATIEDQLAMLETIIQHEFETGKSISSDLIS